MQLTPPTTAANIDITRMLNRVKSWVNEVVLIISKGKIMPCMICIVNVYALTTRTNVWICSLKHGIFKIYCVFMFQQQNLWMRRRRKVMSPIHFMQPTQYCKMYDTPFKQPAPAKKSPGIVVLHMSEAAPGTPTGLWARRWRHHRTWGASTSWSGVSVWPWQDSRTGTETWNKHWLVKQNQH